MRSPGSAPARCETSGVTSPLGAPTSGLTLLATNQIWRYWGMGSYLSDVIAEGIHDIDLWLGNQHVNIDAHGIYNLSEIKSMLSCHGVAVRTLTPEQGNPKAYNVASCDNVIKRLTRVYYRQVIHLAKELRAERISINAGWFPYDVELERARDCLITMLCEVCSMADSEGIEVCLETLVRKPYRLVCDLPDLLCVLDKVDASNLKATLDTGTIARNGESLLSYLEQLGNRIGYVHLTNLAPSVFAHLAWGDPLGTLDGVMICGQLAQGGYEGHCALEMTYAPYFATPREVLSRALTTLEGCECRC